MKANVLTEWNKLEFKDVEKPTPKAGEVLVKVIYGGVCGSDVHISKHHHATATIPRILCHEILGRVEEINSNESLPYQVGDRVVIFPLRWCGVCEACEEGNFHVCRNLNIIGVHRDGGFAEYVCENTDNICKVPDTMPDKLAVLTEPFAVGFHANKRANTKPGDKVLIIGGGPIGLLTAITARYFRASKIIISEISAKKEKLLQDFGFDVINPMKDDLIKETNQITDGEGFDIILEASGSRSGYANLLDICKIRGKIVSIGLPGDRIELNISPLISKEISILGNRVYSRQDFRRTIGMLEELVSEGAYNYYKIIDDIFSLDQLKQAIDLISAGESLGKILITVSDGC